MVYIVSYELHNNRAHEKRNSMKLMMWGGQFDQKSESMRV